MQIPPWEFAQIKLLRQKLLDQSVWGPCNRGSWSLSSSQGWVCREHFGLHLSHSGAFVVCWPLLPAAHPAPLYNNLKNNLERLERER